MVFKKGHPVYGGVKFKKGQKSWNKGIPVHTNPKYEFKKGEVAGEKNPHYGKKHTEETKQILKEQARKRIGEKANNWKGGITKLNNSIRTSFEYRLWVKYCMERDEFTCQDCKIVGGNLEVHHMKSFLKIVQENNIRTIEDARKCQELWELDNGITLCEDCHCKIDKNRRKKR